MPMSVMPPTIGWQSWHWSDADWEWVVTYQRTFREVVLYETNCEEVSLNQKLGNIIYYTPKQDFKSIFFLNPRLILN